MPSWPSCFFRNFIYADSKKAFSTTAAMAKHFKMRQLLKICKGFWLAKYDVCQADPPSFSGTIFTSIAQRPFQHQQQWRKITQCVSCLTGSPVPTPTCSWIMPQGITGIYIMHFDHPPNHWGRGEFFSILFCHFLVIYCRFLDFFYILTVQVVLTHFVY